MGRRETECDHSGVTDKPRGERWRATGDSGYDDGAFFVV